MRDDTRREENRKLKKRQQDEINILYDSGMLFRDADRIKKNAPPTEPLWGFMLFRKAITSIVGDPGACKTTMGYAMCMALGKGKPFLDVTPNEHIRSLYLDFESSDNLIGSRMTLLGDEPSQNFTIYNYADYYLPDLTSKIIEYVGKENVNLIIIDNQTMAFNTQDENDNSEAKQEMRYLRRIAQSTNTSIIVYHHPSKANAPGMRKGSGAFARARLADVMLNLDDVGESVVRLLQTKNRFCDVDLCWYIKKQEGTFTFCDPPLGVSGQRTDTKIFEVQRAILDRMNNGQKLKRNELIAALANSFEERIVQSGIDRMVQLGVLQRPEYGYYTVREMIKL